MSEYRLYRVLRNAEGKHVGNEYMGILVTCKECKFIRTYEDETSFYYCALEVRPNRQWSVDDTDYCSWGEVDNEQMD